MIRARALAFSDWIGHRLPAVRPDRIQTCFELQFERDAVGHRVHVALACFWCFVCSFPTSAIEIAQLPVILYSLLRLTNTHRLTNSIALQPLVLLIATFAAWSAISLAWSLDRAQGLDDLSVMRWCWCLWLLWPIMDRREWLVIAMAAGFVPGLLVQGLHRSGVDFGLDWLKFTRPPGRWSGWWDPAVGGSLLVAGLGLHVPAAFLGRGRTRIVGMIGVLAMMAGILATGTRGAWIAGAGVLAMGVLAGLWCLCRRRALSPGAAVEHRPSVRAPKTVIATVVVVAICVVGFVTWRALAPGIEARVNETRRELEAAQRGDLSTFTGARVLMAREALSAIAMNPLRGVGVGGFERWAKQHVESVEPGASEKLRDRLHSHAHNTLLHIAATTGAIGLLIAMAIAALAVFGAVHPRILPTREAWGTYEAGPVFALLGLGLVSAFDTLHVNLQTMAVGCTLLGLCMLHPPRPRVR